MHNYETGQPEARVSINEVVNLMEFLIPFCRGEGKSYLTIGLGFIGERHRSPVLGAGTS